MLSPVAISSLPLRHDYRFVAVAVPAGFPSPAGDDLEDTIDPFSWIVRREASTYWWRVSGDSLIDLGIIDGDLVAVDRSGKLRHGRIVVAVVDGSVTVKVAERREGRLWLVPKAKGRGYEPILVTETTEIWGVVAGLARRYPVD
jgi:DNA polymerase V